MQDKYSDFYDYVAGYYDKDVELGFESWAKENPILEKIRNDFRQITTRYAFKNALEIGCGPGFDVTWFAREFPDREITGIDISSRMVESAKKRISSMHLSNAKVIVSDERDLPKHFKSETFDMIFVYFGALNTVPNLGFAARQINNLLKPGGYTVLTFVNKWYLREMIVQALKMNFKTAFARLREDWGGYSPERHLPSKCYSPKQIRNTFADFSLLERKGYSILFPAWYNFNKFLDQEEKTEKLWNIDHRLQNTPFWSAGEYTLFVFKK